MAPQRCLVVGGAGFLGRHLVDALVDSFDVSTFDLRESGDSRVKPFIGDIRKIKDVTKACKGMDVVFHCATIAQGSAAASSKALTHAVNVLGTQNVIEACRACRVPKLVYTSSASVVFNGMDLIDADESLPYATRQLDTYTETKIEAEKLVLAANGAGGLATIALRPSGIIGEWDTLYVPTIVEKAKQGKMRFILGNGRNMMEYTYAGNVADAHILAAEKLSLDSKVAGQAYFITNDDPMPLWDFMGSVLEQLGYGRPHIKLPWYPIYLAALFFEWVVAPLLRPFVKLAPSDFSSHRIRLAVSTRLISCEKAKQELGYKPRVPLKEAIQRTVAHFQPLTKGMEYKKVR